MQQPYVQKGSHNLRHKLKESVGFHCQLSPLVNQRGLQGRTGPFIPTVPDGSSDTLPVGRAHRAGQM